MFTKSEMDESVDEEIKYETITLEQAKELGVKFKHNQMMDSD